MTRYDDMSGAFSGADEKSNPHLPDRLAPRRRKPRRMDLADLTEVVLTFAKLVERPLSRQNIKLKLDIDSVPILAVEANQMHQVLGSLLTTAEVAMPVGGELRLSVGCDMQWVYLDFADTTAPHVPHCQARPDAVTTLNAMRPIVAELGGELSRPAKTPQIANFRIRFPHPSVNRI